MSARRAGLALGAAVLVAAGAGPAAAEVGPPNYSSHDAAFFADLLSDRVWLHERPRSAQAGDRGLVWGIYHGADGTALACIHLDGTWQARTGRWRTVPSPRFRALYNYYRAGTAPDPGHVKGHVPVFYDPETGRLHSESLGAGDSPGDWLVLSLGWVQESWPRALKEACPDLDLPAGLPVNERQTSTVMEEANAQDPDAPLRAHAGAELRAPGSTGLAMARGAPRLTADELRGFLIANNGDVLESPAGARLVLALGHARDELWRLDADGEVADTAVLLPSSDGAGIVVQWERLPRRQDYRVGDPFPLRPTGVRYGAFVLMDRLITEGRPVALAFGGDGAVTLKFGEGGTVTAPATDGGTIEGRWWWSRGHLHVALESAAETIAWPWQVLAVHSGAGPDAPAGGNGGGVSGR